MYPRTARTRNIGVPGSLLRKKRFGQQTKENTGISSKQQKRGGEDAQPESGGVQKGRGSRGKNLIIRLSGRGFRSHPKPCDRIKENKLNDYALNHNREGVNRGEEDY